MNKDEAINQGIPFIQNYFKNRSEIKDREQRPSYDPWKNQIRAAQCIEEFILSDRAAMLNVEPPSAGKTYTLSRAQMRHMELLEGLIYVILLPRLSLSEQVLKEFNMLRDGNLPTEFLSVCSGGNYEAQQYAEDLESLQIKPTTKPIKIREALDRATAARPLTIFCLYHSTGVLYEALDGREIDLLQPDEAHNLAIHRDFFEAIDPDSERCLKTKKTIFHTATPVIFTNNSPRSMDNIAIFGKRDHYTPPLELIADGRILQPNLRTVVIDGVIPTYKNIVKDDGLSKERFEALASVYATMEAQEEVVRKWSIEAGIKEEESRLLTFCNDSCSQPRFFLKNELLKRRFPDYLMGMISSNKNQPGLPYSREGAWYREPGSDRIRPTRRADLLVKVESYYHTALFHFNTVAEGTNLPSLTGTLPLRGLAEHIMIQGLNRSCRVCLEDKEGIKTGRLWVGDTSPAWRQKAGLIWLPITSRLTEKDKEGIKYYVETLLSHDFQFDVNDVCRVMPKSGEVKIFANERGDTVDSLDDSVLTALITSEVEKAAKNWSSNWAEVGLNKGYCKLAEMTDEELTTIRGLLAEAMESAAARRKK